MGKEQIVSKKPRKAMANPPLGRKEWILMNSMEQATLKDLRKAAQQTQEDLAAALGVGQGAVSRLEKSSDMLLSTLQHYVQSVGGRLEMVATFPNRPSLLIGRLGKKTAAKNKPAPGNARLDMNGSKARTLRSPGQQVTRIG